MGSDISRRDVMRTGGAAVVGGYLVAGCSVFSTKAKKKGADKSAGTGYKGKEAPMLAALVKQKKLPPLAERLPAKPAVLKPLTSTGLYGGTLRKGHIDPGQNDGTGMAHCNLAEWNLEANTPTPGLAEKWDIARRRQVLHLSPAQGPQVVRRQTVHGRRHGLLLQVDLSQQDASAVAADLADQRQQADEADQDRRRHLPDRLRRAAGPAAQVSLLPGPGHGGHQPGALPQAVPS